MGKIALLIGLAGLAACLTGCTMGGVGQRESDGMTNHSQIGLVIHGGSGAMKRESMSPERQAAYRAALEEAYRAGYSVLEKGGKSVEAVEASIRVLEDSPLFNAGKGAVFAADGKNELDASIMDGRTLAAGAVAGVRHVKNPISLARLVMEKSPHVMLIGEGAEEFAKTQGVTLVDEQYFWTQERWDELLRAKKQEEAATRPGAGGAKGGQTEQFHFGTVGAAALDREGNLAAGTSTGGMTNKKWGRVGDSPIIGAGTYADNRTCAVSSTGWGEYYIRLGVARDISAMMEYKGMGVQEAVDEEIKKVGKLGGNGGVIALDKAGRVGIAFNTEGMFRVHRGSDGKVMVEIYR